MSRETKKCIIIGLIIGLALVLLLALASCESGEEMTVVSVYSTGPEVVVVVEDDNGDKYETRWGNTGPDAWTVEEGDTMRVDLEGKYPANEWTPIG